MTIDEAIQRLIATREQKGRFSVNECIALEMAIASLEAWEKVKAEIEDEKIDFDINIGMEKYYNNAIDDVLQIIDKHLQEVTG